MIPICGIAGFSLARNSTIDPRALADALLRQIVSRGQDASGLAFVNPKGDKLTIVKADAAAGRFIGAEGTAELVPGVRSAIMHTRYATKGDPINDHNNHPVYSGRIIAVHNGHVSNDDSVFRTYPAVKRLAQVDSEAIPALLDQTDKHPEEVLHRLEGGIATAWFDTRDVSSLHLARVRSSPLTVAQTKGGSFFFASEAGMVDRVAEELNLTIVWKETVAEATLLRIKAGRVVDHMRIPGAVPTPVKARKATRTTTIAPAKKATPPALPMAATGTADRRAKLLIRLRAENPDATITDLLDQVEASLAAQDAPIAADQASTVVFSELEAEQAVADAELSAAAASEELTAMQVR